MECEVKTAICFSGQPRSMQYTHQNLRKVFDDYFEDYDIFAHIPVCSTDNQVLEYFPKAIVKIVPDQHIDESKILGSRFKTGPQRYLQQINGMKQVNLLRKQKEQADNFKYDFVIRCRMDVKFTTSLPRLNTLSNERIYIPDFHHFGGINDRFCIGSSDLIDNYMNIIDTYFDEGIRNGHAETFLRYCLDKKNTKIELIDIRFNRVLEDGTEHFHDSQAPSGEIIL